MGFRKGSKTRNPELLRGHARLEARDGESFRVSVNGVAVRARQLVLNTGTRTLIPPIPGIDTVDLIHSGNWLDKPELPEHIVMIGGGYIGIEMGQFYRRMGSRVTVVEKSGKILGHEDDDISSALQGLLEKEGIEFRMNTGVKRVQRSGEGVSLTLDSSELKASHLFVATGRKPNTDDLGLENIGVRLSDHGIVEADHRLATNVKSVWVAGDIRGGPLFTHTSWDDYRILLSQITGDGSRTTDRIVPYAVFTDPELGRVGMTEAEARKAGRQIKVARFEMNRNGKAREMGESEGFIKVIVDAASSQILGAAVLAADGAELVHLYIDLMNAGAPYPVLRDAIHIHPTLAEAVQSAVSSLE